jgi:c-di-AMP phosphodiesterase-like protein
VLDFYLKRYKGFKYVTYADDGLIFMKNKFEIRKILRDLEMLETAGIKLSFKTRPNGTKATGFAKNVLYFLGIE